MKVIIPVNSQNLPKIRTLIEVIHHLGPYSDSDSFVFLTTASNTATLRQIINHIPQATVDKGLSGTVRRFPTSANELFLEAARYAAAHFGPDQAWVYLTPESLPVKNQWLANLERQYLGQPKPFMGILDYLPQKITDAQGITRVNFGEPYLLETAVYPSDLAKRITENLISINSHHEQIRRKSTAPHTHETKLIFSAKWKENLSIAEAPEEAVLLARVYDIKDVARQITTGTPAPVVIPAPPAAAPAAPQPDPVPAPLPPPAAPLGTHVDADGRVHLGFRPAPPPAPDLDPTPDPAPAPTSLPPDLEESTQEVMVIAKKKRKATKASS